MKMQDLMIHLREDNSQLEEGAYIQAGWYNARTGEHLENPEPMHINHIELWQQSRGGDFVPVKEFYKIYDQGFVRYWLAGNPERGQLTLSGNEKDLNSPEFKKFLSTLPLHSNFNLIVNNEELGTFNET